MSKTEVVSEKVSKSPLSGSDALMNRRTGLSSLQTWSSTSAMVGPSFTLVTVTSHSSVSVVPAASMTVTVRICTPTCSLVGMKSTTPPGNIGKSSGWTEMMCSSVGSSSRSGSVKPMV